MDLANLHPDLVDLNLLAGPSLPSPLCSPIVHVAAGQGCAARHHVVPECESSSCEQRGERERRQRGKRERESWHLEEMEREEREPVDGPSIVWGMGSRSPRGVGGLERRLSEFGLWRK